MNKLFWALGCLAAATVVYGLPRALWSWKMGAANGLYSRPPEWVYDLTYQLEMIMGWTRSLIIGIAILTGLTGWFMIKVFYRRL